MRNRRSALVAALVVGACLSARGQAPVARAVEGAAAERTLANGLTVIVVERHDRPTFGGVVGCLAGSAFDPPGGIGTAHLVEHFMAPIVKETEGPPKELYQELAQEYQRTRGAASPRIGELEARIAEMKGRGASANIGTAADVVWYGAMNYPADWLDRFLQAGADTLKQDPEGFIATQAGSLINEITKTIAADARGRVTTPLLATAFPNHPYGAPVGGRVADVRAMTLESLRAFKKTYYAPGRCVVVASGDVRPAIVFALAERYFGALPPQPPPPGAVPEAPARRERRAVVESAAGPRLLVSFVKPPAPSRDDAVAEVVSSLLARGPSGRLRADLVDARKLAASVSGGNGGPGQLYDNLLTLDAVPADGHRVEELEPAVLAQLESLEAEPVGQAELQAAISSRLAAWDETCKADFDLAHAIMRHQLATGDWKQLWRARETLGGITAADVQSFARRYFVPENRVVLTLVKPPR